MSDGIPTLVELIEEAPIPEEERANNLPLFLGPQLTARVLAFHDWYTRILELPGVLMQFGVRYGRDLALLAYLRRLLEPRQPRKIIGFDTFTGLRGDDITDADGEKAEAGAYDTPEHYVHYLGQVLATWSHGHPSTDQRAFELHIGDAQETLPVYLEQAPGPVAFVHFDMDLYKPTRACLDLLRDRLPRGAVVAFDQFHTPHWRGEARALFDTLGYRNVTLRRCPFHRYWTFAIMD